MPQRRQGLQSVLSYSCKSTCFISTTVQILTHCGGKVGNLYRNADEVVCLVDRSANGGRVQRGEIGLVSRCICCFARIACIQLTCFTRTKVQILTPEELRVCSSSYTSEGGILPANMVRVIFPVGPPGAPGLGRGRELELNAHTGLLPLLVCY